MKEKLDSKILRVHSSFHNRVKLFIKEFEKQNGIIISSTMATKIIDNKIERLGGLVIEDYE